MRLSAMIFILFGYTVFLVLFNSTGTYGASIDFPSLVIPEPEFIDISAGCSGFTDCTEYLANVIKNIGAGIILTVEFTFNLLLYMGRIFLLIAGLLVDPFPGAPWWITSMVLTMFSAMLGISIYRAVRSGEDDA